MEYTGERYTPALDQPEMSYEHWHRYLFAEDFAVGKTVLDIASGEGYGSAYLARTAASVLGVDIDGTSVDHATSTYRHSNLEFRRGEANAIPVDQEHVFDLIVSFETIEHLDSGQQQGFLVEIERLLKPDGIAIISTPNRVLYSPSNRKRNQFHLHEFDEAEFIDFFAPKFSNVQIVGQHVYPASHLWPVTENSAPLREHQIKRENGRFEPLLSDEKARYFLLAVCSNVDTATLPRSLLLDLTPKPSPYGIRQLNLGQLEFFIRLKLMRIRSRVLSVLRPGAS